MSYTPQENLSITSDIGINSDSVISGGNWSGDTYTGAGELNDYAYVGVNLQVDESGTLFFDFSQDGTNWSTYPVAGFAVASGINEVHTAWKGGRYMRPRFVGTGGRSYFRLKTYYSNLPLPLSAPLNQSLGADQDATVVRSVGIGEDPLGVYVNSKLDGVAFQTLDNLASGATFNSAVLDAQGYTQVQTHIVCDNDGTLGFKFCSTSNCSGTTAGQDGVERYLSVPYVAANGFQLYSAPAFTPYLQYSFTNDGTGTTTQLFYETKLLTKSLSGQLLAMDSFISPAMVANLGRNVIVGKDPDGTFVNQKVSGVDSNNSSTTVLSGGTLTFTGDWSDITEYAGITVLIDGTATGTTSGTLQLQFSHDGVTVNRNIQITADDIASVPPRTLGTVAKFFRVVYTTDGDLTSFDAQTMLHTEQVQLVGRLNSTLQGNEDVALVRSAIAAQDDAGNWDNVKVDSLGDLRVSIENPNTAFGEVQIAEMTPVIQVTYPYNVNTEIVNTTTANGASVTQADNMVSLSTSGTSASTTTLETLNVAKYRAGQGIVARFTGLFTSTATTTDSHQVIGIGDETDGYFFGYSGSTFGIHHRINSGTTFIAQTTWNVDTMDGDSDAANPSGVNLDPTKGNVFQVQYQWLGYGAINFYVESDVTGKYVPVHQIKYANANTVPSSYNPTFPIRAEVDNGTSTDVLTMRSASMAAFVEGKNQITGPLQSASGSNTGGANGELLALRGVSVFPTGSTETNRVVAYLRDLSIANDGANNTIVRVQIIEDAVYSVAPTFTYTDPDNSVIEVGAGGTYTAGTGKIIASFGVTEVGSTFAELTSRNIAIRPGKTISFITQGDNSTETIVDISWVEDF
jgi:hypothetical protein